jgi:5-enolpyruvylshikimate-3-phosphate synthase
MDIPVVEVDNRLKITGLLTPDPNKKAEEEDEDEEDGEKKEAEEEAVKEPVVIDSHNDHRIAMAFGVFGAANGNVIIDGAECVAKTYPDFWETLQSVGGELKIDRE